MLAKRASLGSPPQLLTRVPWLDHGQTPVLDLITAKLRSWAEPNYGPVVMRQWVTDRGWKWGGGLGRFDVREKKETGGRERGRGDKKRRRDAMTIHSLTAEAEVQPIKWSNDGMVKPIYGQMDAMPRHRLTAEAEVGQKVKFYGQVIEWSNRLNGQMIVWSNRFMVKSLNGQTD